MIKVQPLVVLIAFLAGCGSTSREEAIPVPLNRQAVDSIAVYLEANAVRPAFGGKVLCSCQTLTTEQRGETTVAYVWAFCQEYYRQAQALN